MAGSRPCRGQGPVVSWAPGCRVAAPAREPCAVSRAYALPCRAPTQRCVAGCPSAVSWHAWPYRRHSRAPGRPCPGLVVLYCNTAQPFLLKSVTNFISLYCDTSLLIPQACLSHNCIAIQLPIHPAYCNTIFPAHCTSNKPSYCNTPLNPAIQFLPHNTNWAVALPNLHHFFFHYNYYSYLFIFFSISKSWKNH